MVNTDYTFNGEPISESFVIEAAEVEGLSVDEYVNQKDGLETVEVTEEIQTEPTEGKTNGAVAKGATATPVTGQAPESTGLNSENYFSVPPSEILEQGKFVRTEEGVRFAEEGEIILAEPEKV